MSLNNKTAENGTFRKRQGFTMASNAAIRDRELSLKAKGLYTLIMSYATMPGLTLTKSFLATHCLEKERAFNSAWDELKTHGFLKVYFTPSGANNRWCVEYELLDEADPAHGDHTARHNEAVAEDRGLRQKALQADQVAGVVAVRFGLAQTNAVEDRSGVQLIGNHSTHSIEQRLEETAVGIEAGGI